MFDPAIINNYHEGLVLGAFFYAYLISLLGHVKGLYFPSFPKDTNKSGSLVYDFMMGVELNPRFGEYFDWKLFHNGRPGICAWTLINLSYAAAQY